MFGINETLINPEELDKSKTSEQFKENYKLLIDEICLRNPDTEIVILGATYNDCSVDNHCQITS